MGRGFCFFQARRLAPPPCPCSAGRLPNCLYACNAQSQYGQGWARGRTCLEMPSPDKMKDLPQEQRNTISVNFEDNVWILILYAQLDCIENVENRHGRCRDSLVMFTRTSLDNFVHSPCIYLLLLQDVVVNFTSRSPHCVIIACQIQQRVQKVNSRFRFFIDVNSIQNGHYFRVSTQHKHPVLGLKLTTAQDIRDMLKCTLHTTGKTTKLHCPLVTHKVLCLCQHKL